MPIRLLAEEVASQIAAGEVVERPASVIKELLENALDAHATTVAMRVEEAGRRLIEVSDDGDGIPADELLLAATRHATSKVSTAEDLFQIRSLGFRGEALASIASVSRMSIVSRPRAVEHAARLQIEGGIAGKVTVTSGAVGTQILVEDLFYNVPARRKFLKSDITEKRQIDDLAARYALAYPEVRFRLVQDGKLVLQSSGQNDAREVLGAIYGVEIGRAMLEVVRAEEDGARLSGFISPLSISRGNRKEMHFFVNRRPIQDAGLAAALLQAYHTHLMVGRYPMAFLFIDLPADQVDVNVHPTKAEVRFSNRDAVFSLVQRGVRRALMAYSPVPELRHPGKPAENSLWGVLHSPGDPSSPGDPGYGPVYDEVSPDQALVQPAEEAGSQSFAAQPLLRLVGQVAATYLIAEGPDGLYLIDQHAAHERVLYERMASQLGGAIAGQHLLNPEVVQLEPATARLLEPQLSALHELGFEVEAFGQNSFIVRAIPAMLNRLAPVQAIRVLVEDFEEDETPLLGQQENRLAARVCKRAAIKGGQVLSVQEQEALLNDLLACASPRTCPHGRPTMIHLSVASLERQFGRRGAR